MKVGNSFWARVSGGGGACRSAEHWRDANATYYRSVVTKWWVGASDESYSSFEVRDVICAANFNFCRQCAAIGV